MANKKNSESSKHAQIKQAANQTFIAVSVASVVVSMSIVTLNFLWGTAKYNSKVQGLQEETRDTLLANLEAVPALETSFGNLEVGDALIPNQPADKKNSEVILDALPSKFDFPALASSINNLARTSSVRLESFRGTDLGGEATQSSPNPSPEVIPFSIEVEGQYTAISKFLKSMEHSIQPIKVISLSLTGTDSKLRASITLETNFQAAFDLNTQTRTVQ